MFHWRDGIKFGRLADGSVRLLVKRESEVLLDEIIPPSEWPQIVAHVARGPVDEETVKQAAALHGVEV